VRQVGSEETKIKGSRERVERGVEEGRAIERASLSPLVRNSDSTDPPEPPTPGQTTTPPPAQTKQYLDVSVHQAHRVQVLDGVGHVQQHLQHRLHVDAHGAVRQLRVELTGPHRVAQRAAVAVLFRGLVWFGLVEWVRWVRSVGVAEVDCIWLRALAKESLERSIQTAAPGHLGGRTSTYSP